MSEDHKKQLNILGEIRDQIKRLADLAEPTRIIFAQKPPPDTLVEAVRRFLMSYDSDVARPEIAQGNNGLVMLLEKAYAAHKQTGGG